MPPPLPDPLGALLREALRDTAGESVQLRDAAAVSGGCIHRALKLETSAGPFFLKWNEGDAGRGFESEARSLEALAQAAEAAGLLRVPDVVAVRDADEDDPGFLLLEYLPPSAPQRGYAEALGEGLRALHETPASDDAGFGWPEENRIGPLAQLNPSSATWAEFWRDARIAPQLEAAFQEGGLGSGDRSWTDALLTAVPVALEGVANAPELVHGDLWSGNVHPGPDGRPVLVDPAAYRGRGEVDLAMAQLFGGFDRSTFAAYGPLLQGWEEVRRPVYQLYYLLVHLRLFGSGYYAGTRRAAEKVIAAVG